MSYSRLDMGRLGLAVAVALTFGTSAVVWATTKGPDASGYSGTDATTFSFVDISSGGTSVLAGADDSAALLALPFQFRFYGQPYGLVCVSSNGALYFVASANACAVVSESDFANTDLSGVVPTGDRPALLPFWSDLTFEVPGSGSVFYQVVGAPGSRRMIVQWNNAFPQGSPNPVTFQVILSESNNSALFQYKTVSLGAANPASNGGQATIGIRNTGAPANQQLVAWSFGAKVLANDSALLFTFNVAGDVNSDGVVSCADVNAVRAAIGRRRGLAGYTAAADLNSDGIINVLDLTLVTRRLPAGTSC